MHGDVLQKPPPAVLFKKLGVSTMDFDLICIVGEVDVVGRVTSDLNYVIHRRLAELEPAAAAAELTVRGLDGVERSLGDIARAVDRKTKPRPPPTARSGARPASAPAEEDEAEATPAGPPTPPSDPAEAESKIENKE